MIGQSHQFASVRNLTYNLAFLAALLGCASSAIAQTPRTFTATGNMTTPRAAPGPFCSGMEES